MKKLLLIFLLIIFTNNAYAANWFLINTDDNYKAYVDTENIKKIDGYVYVWSMIDFKEVDDDFNIDNFSVLSLQVYDQIECDIGKRKRLTYIFSDGNMGKGNRKVETPNDPEWQYLAPETIEYNVKTLACNIVDN